MFSFLRSLALRPLEWIQAIRATGHPSPLIPEILDAAFEQAQAIVVLLTGDDEVRLNPSLWQADESAAEKEYGLQARPNVLFEAGLALGRSRDRTVFVQLGTVKAFSDNAGRHVVHLDNSSQKRQELATKLTLARCAVDVSGTEWHTAGNFEGNAAKALPATPVLSRSPESALFGAPISTSVEVTEPSLTSASNFTCSIVKTNDYYWRFGWKLSVSNLSRGDTTYRIECRFQDRLGHMVESTPDNSGVILRPGETKDLSGLANVETALAGTVARVLAVVSRRGLAKHE